MNDVNVVFMYNKWHALLIALHEEVLLPGVARELLGMSFSASLWRGYGRTSKDVEKIGERID